MPEYSFLYLGDTAWVPYGPRDPQRIHDRTFVCCEWLFRQWCHLVILACNSASTYAIRSWQATFPSRKMLSVTLPGVEAVIARDYHHIGVVGTPATIRSGLYPDFFARHFPNYPIQIDQLEWGNLVDLIEHNAPDAEILDVCKQLFSSVHDERDALILWCTHYPIILEHIQKYLPKKIEYIDPARESAKKLPAYLSSHTEIDTLLLRDGSIRFCATALPASFSNVGNKIWKESLHIEHVHIEED